MTLFDARTLARGWLSVATASAKDSGRPALDRTVFVEAYPEGLRLVATDSYVLLHSWVPNLNNYLDPDVALDEAPYGTAVTMDEHGRAKGFLAHVLKLAKAQGPDDAPIEVDVQIGIPDPGGDADHPSLSGMEARYVVLELRDQERLKLRTYEGQFPVWRTLVQGFSPMSTETMGLAPSIVGRLAKLGEVQPGTMLGFQWSGPEAAARVELVGSEPSVEGLVMPCRWDFYKNEPRMDDKAEVEPSAEADDDWEDPPREGPSAEVAPLAKKRAERAAAAKGEK